MTGFRYQGSIPSSKSLYNRALVAQTFRPGLQVKGSSDCDDVRMMKKAIVSMIKKTAIDCGEAGTVLRFMAMRCSREPGVHHLSGSARLLKRPQEEIAYILNQLSVNVELLPTGVVIQSEGWKRPLLPIQIPRARSSQFASGLLLSSWNLPFDLTLEMTGSFVSEGYWQMSCALARDLGLQFEQNQKQVKVAANQSVGVSEIEIETDSSSLFSVSAAAVVAGEIEVPGVPLQSLQPDHVFIDFFRQMQIPLQLQNGVLKINRASKILPLKVSLENTPDLFPVLATLCSFAHGVSELRGAPQLAHKESDRLQKTHELLEMAGVHSVLQKGGLTVHGLGMDFQPKAFTFDPDQDHRMAMAAALFRLKQSKIRILHPEVVKKSFPGFWSVVGLG